MVNHENFSWNDVYFWMNENADYGYLTSNRDGANFDSIPHCCSDIWKFKSIQPLANENKISSKEIFKKRTGITLPLALYFMLGSTPFRKCALAV